ncbi:MAG: hypothetical protein ACXV8J_03030 [Methylobacter sp.]
MISLGLISWKLNLTDNLAQNRAPATTATILIVTAYAMVRFLNKTEHLKSMR